MNKCYWHTITPDGRKKEKKVVGAQKKLGEYHRLVKELELDGEKFHQYFRMSTEQLSHIVAIIGSELAKQVTNFSQTIGVEERLVDTIRWEIFRLVVWKDNIITRHICKYTSCKINLTLSWSLF